MDVMVVKPKVSQLSSYRAKRRDLVNRQTMNLSREEICVVFRAAQLMNVVVC